MMAKKYGKKAQQKVKRAMHERKGGTLRSGRSGKKVTSRKQAIAIGLSEARRAGAKVPRKQQPRSGRSGGSGREKNTVRSQRGKAPAGVKRTVARQRAVQRQVARADRAHPGNVRPSAPCRRARAVIRNRHSHASTSASPARSATSTRRRCLTRRFYLGSSKLHGKVALITGGDSGDPQRGRGPVRARGRRRRDPVPLRARRCGSDEEPPSRPKAGAQSWFPATSSRRVLLREGGAADRRRSSAGSTCW